MSRVKVAGSGDGQPGRRYRRSGPADHEPRRPVAIGGHRRPANVDRAPVVAPTVWRKRRAAAEPPVKFTVAPLSALMATEVAASVDPVALTVTPDAVICDPAPVAKSPVPPAPVNVTVVGGHIRVTEPPFSASTVGKKIAEVEKNIALTRPGDEGVCARCPGRAEVCCRRVGSDGEARVAREGKDIVWLALSAVQAATAAVQTSQLSAKLTQLAPPRSSARYGENGPKDRIACGMQGRPVEYSLQRSCKPADVEAAAHTPSTRLRCPPRKSWGRCLPRDVYGCPSGAGKEGRPIAIGANVRIARPTGIRRLRRFRRAGRWTHRCCPSRARRRRRRAKRSRPASS